ncbi:MAG: UvrD-helicase domain-containing protein [Lachnospiraceae bacterium]|nr:UvrD-helicase domain-containing protein [Lachnospiraceae bacterium]
MGFSPSQQKIIDHRSGSLLVSAAAGSGKTSTLVAHVVKYVENGGDLGRLIIVTYTRTAAGEMRERIRIALEEAVNRQPSERHLRHQLAILPQARISTVDSLCSRLVRSYFQQIDGLMPDIRIAEEAEIRLLSQDILEAVLEEAYSAADPDFYALLDGYSSEKGHQEIMEQILLLYDSAQNAPFPEAWMDRALPAFPQTANALRQLPWMEQSVRSIRETLGELAARQDALLGELEERDAAGGALGALLREERNQIGQWLAADDYWQLRQALTAWKPAALSKKEYKRDPAFETVREVRGGLTTGGYFSLLAPLRKAPYIGPEEELRLLNLTAAPGRALIALTKCFAEKREAACRERGIATFMDMEHYALRLLVEKNADGQPVPTELARELQKGLDEIIVDEYQDINQVQEYILRGLSGEDAGRPNLFMVGDVKQSIYRFRRADPGIFMRKYAEFSPEDGAPHRKILLQDNYRSRAAVLNSTNRLFARMMDRRFGGVDYDKSAALHPAAAFSGEDPKTRVLLLEAEGNAEARLKEEGRLIAWQIRRLMAENRQIREKGPDGTVRLRPLSFGDIVILCRSLKYGAALGRVLKSCGLPAVAQETKGFYDTLEVQTLLSLLAVLDNPRQDIPLTAVLLSPFGGFTQKDLAEALPQAGGAGEDLLDRLRKLPPETAEGRFVRFLEKLENWREAAGIRSVPELLDYLLEESGWELYLKATSSGAVRLANLRQLKEMAQAYEDSSYRGLYQFLRYVDRQKDLQLDVGEAPLLSDGSDVVRIGTLHSSKGLEYPVVFLAGLEKHFNERDIGSPILIHADHGLALESRDREALMKYKNVWHRFVGGEIRRDGRAEELRLLYVGMTRAVEQLFLVAALRGELPEELEKRKDMKPEAAASFLDWLLACRAAGDDLGMAWEGYRPEEIPQPEEAALSEQLARFEAAEREQDPKLLAAVRDQFDWRYPYPPLKKMSWSVSELKQADAGKADAHSAEAPARRPFLSDPAEPDAEEISAAEKGTLFHKLMEHLPPERAGSREDAAAWLTEAKAAGLFSETQAASLDPEIAAEFYRQPVGHRALAAAAKGKLQREKPFILGVPAREPDPSDSSGEIVLVQGIIDLYFEEEDRLILVDYKTDRVRSGTELIRRYETQLRWYSRALAAASGKTVGEVYIYSTALREFVRL